MDEIIRKKSQNMPKYAFFFKFYAKYAINWVLWKNLRNMQNMQNDVSVKWNVFLWNV